MPSITISMLDMGDGGRLGQIQTKFFNAVVMSAVLPSDFATISNHAVIITLNPKYAISTSELNKPIVYIDT